VLSLPPANGGLADRGEQLVARNTLGRLIKQGLGGSHGREQIAQIMNRFATTGGSKESWKYLFHLDRHITLPSSEGPVWIAVAARSIRNIPEGSTLARKPINGAMLTSLKKTFVTAINPDGLCPVITNDPVSRS
jgi:hypothetical protein